MEGAGTQMSSWYEQSARSNVDDHIRTSVLQAAVDDASQALDQDQANSAAGTAEDAPARTAVATVMNKKSHGAAFGKRSKSTAVKSGRKAENAPGPTADSQVSFNM